MPWTRVWIFRVYGFGLSVWLPPGVWSLRIVDVGFRMKTSSTTIPSQLTIISTVFFAPQRPVTLIPKPRKP